MKVTQISVGRFHHFHLARQLERLGLLDKIYTGYPKFKLKDEPGVPQDKIITYPWVHTPYMKRYWLGLDKFPWLTREWMWAGMDTLDKYVASQLKDPTILIALCANGYRSGQRVQQLGGKFVCDRPCSHIVYQDNLMKEEYSRWGLSFSGSDPRTVQKEENEYRIADVVSVPSEFAKRSFIESGIPEEKLVKITYGARLERFQKVADPDPNKFVVLWVGSVSFRKGFLYALEAFNNFKHPNKVFKVIGPVDHTYKKLIDKQNLQNVEFYGRVQNADLPAIYSSANIFVFPSIEDGFGMVMGEAMACGLPVIATNHTGAEDLYEDGKEGFIIPIRRPDLIVDRLTQIADEPHLREQMSDLSMKAVTKLGGWDQYGDDYDKLVKSLQ